MIKLGKFSEFPKLRSDALALLFGSWLSNLVWQCARCDGFQGLSLSINHHEHEPSVCVNNTNPDFEGTKRGTQTNLCRMEKIISAAPFLELLRHLFTLHKERSCRCKLSFINHYQLHTAHQFGISASALHAENPSFENELSFWSGKHCRVRNGSEENAIRTQFQKKTQVILILGLCVLLHLGQRKVREDT